VLKGDLIFADEEGVPRGHPQVMWVDSKNFLDEGLMIGEIGRRMNSKVKSVKQGGYQK
jgi:hypothetical protein